MGKTFATIEAIVATKIIAECQAGALNPDGGVSCHSPAEMNVIRINGSHLTPLPFSQSRLRTYGYGEYIHQINIFI